MPHVVLQAGNNIIGFVGSEFCHPHPADSLHFLRRPVVATLPFDLVQMIGELVPELGAVLVLRLARRGAEIFLELRERIVCRKTAPACLAGGRCLLVLGLQNR
jgi:hypothetical protein